MHRQHGEAPPHKPTRLVRARAVPPKAKTIHKLASSPFKLGHFVDDERDISLVAGGPMGAIEKEVQEPPPSTAPHHGACTQSSTSNISVNGVRYFTGNLPTSPEESEVVLRSVRDLEAELRALREYYANQAQHITDLERKAKKQEAQMKHQEAVAAELLRKRRARTLQTDCDVRAVRQDKFIHRGAVHTSPTTWGWQGMDAGRNKFDSPLAAQPDSRGNQSTTGATRTHVITPVLAPVGNVSSTPKDVGVHPAEPLGDPHSTDSVTSTSKTGIGTVDASVPHGGVSGNDVIPGRRASNEKMESAATASRAARASIPPAGCTRSAIVPPITPRRVEVFPRSSTATLDENRKASLPSGNEALCAVVHPVAQEQESRSLDAAPLPTGKGEANGNTRGKQKKRNGTEAWPNHLQSLGGRKKSRAECAGNLAGDLGIAIPIADRLCRNAEGAIVSMVRPISGKEREGQVASDSQSEWALLLQLSEVAREFE